MVSQQDELRRKAGLARELFPSAADCPGQIGARIGIIHQQRLAPAADDLIREEAPPRKKLGLIGAEYLVYLHRVGMADKIYPLLLQEPGMKGGLH